MEIENKLCIVVMTNGFISVGIISQNKDDFIFYNLSNSGTIRRWGTTEGLGQLAREGPLKNTIIDKEPFNNLINKNYIIKIIPCNENKWNKYINSF